MSVIFPKMGRRGSRYWLVDNIVTRVSYRCYFRNYLGAWLALCSHSISSNHTALPCLVTHTINCRMAAVLLLISVDTDSSCLLASISANSPINALISCPETSSSSLARL